MKKIEIKNSLFALSFLLVFVFSSLAVLTGCSNSDNSINSSEPKIQEQQFVTTEIGGTLNVQDVLALNCEIKDSPLVQTVLLSVNLRQNMQLLEALDTGADVGLNMGSQGNTSIIFNNVSTVSGKLQLVGGGTELEVSVKLSLDEKTGDNKYTITNQDESVLEIIESKDTSGTIRYTKIGSEAQISCEDFKSLDEILEIINANPMVDPGQVGPQ